MALSVRMFWQTRCERRKGGVSNEDEEDTRSERDAHSEVINGYHSIDVRQFLSCLHERLLLVGQALSFGERRNGPDEMDDVSVVLKRARGVDGLEYLEEPGEEGEEGKKGEEGGTERV